MKALYAALFTLIAFASGCAASLTQAERSELAKYRQADQAARIERAERDGYKPPMPGTADPAAAAPSAPPVTPPAIGQDGAAVASVVLRGEQKLYAAAAGKRDRLVGSGRHLRLDNEFCDGCTMFKRPSQSFNAYMAVKIDGQPVAIIGGQVNQRGEFVFGPHQTIWIDLGDADAVEVTITRYANLGTLDVPQLALDSPHIFRITIDLREQRWYELTETAGWSR